MARIAVLEFEQQASDTPIHFIPKKLVEPFKSHKHKGRKAVIALNDHTLQIIEDVKFSELKAMYKRPVIRVVHESKYGPWDGGKLLPPRGPEGLLITYPLPDQRTVYL